MPHVLLLRFAAPMQSWGVGSRFSIRDTAKEPSKSGVIGLLCAALGISRDDANEANERFVQMTKLQMGVRVLREGVPEKDFHTALDVARADGTVSPHPKHPKFTSLSKYRWYLADADFLVALAGDDAAFLNELHEHLQKPVWQLFLGRKAFVPAEPIYFRKGVFEIESLEKFLADEDGKLEEFLKFCESEAGAKRHEKERQRIVIESETGEETRQDVPRCFAAHDNYRVRRVTTIFTELKIGENDDGNLSDENKIESAVETSSQ